MNLKNTYELRSGYLYVKVTGEFDLPSARAVTLEWVERARVHAINRVLCDITLVNGYDDDHTPTMIRFELAEFAGKAIPNNLKLAIMQREQLLSRDRFVENVMVNRGARVRVTSSLNEALEWLGVDAINKTQMGVAS